MNTKHYERMMYVVSAIWLFCFFEIFFLSSMLHPIVTYIAMGFWVFFWIFCIILCEVLIRKQKQKQSDS